MNPNQQFRRLLSKQTISIKFINNSVSMIMVNFKRMTVAPQKYGKVAMLRLSSFVCAGLIVSGCSISPSPLTLEELKSTQAVRQQQLMEGQEAVVKEISLYEAMARAIKYNLDYRVEIYEQALRVSERKLAKVDLLPQVVASTGLNRRDNFSGSSSSALLGSNTVGEQSLVSSTSSERDVVNSDLRISWDILDFGLSYVRAKQSGDQVLIANERKRRVLNRVIANVRTAYWRAVSAERLVDRLKDLESDIQGALYASEESYRDRQIAPLAALTYQRELLQIQEEIQDMENDLKLAKTQLAALMNIDPGTDYALVVPDRSNNLTAVKFLPSKLVDFALKNRPELRELSYEQRINEREANAALLEILPNLSFFGGFNHNDNDFLFNSSWRSWGAQASWNILNAYRYPFRKRAVEVNGQLLDQRALALTMAIITQVHVSASQFEVAKRSLDTSSRFNNVNNSILEQTVAGHNARKVSDQTLVRERMNQLVSEVRYDIAYADLQNSYADIFATVGLQVHGDVNADEMTVEQLAEHLGDFWIRLKNSMEKKSNG